MIPRHRPPFGVERVLRSAMDWGNRVTPEQVESAYAEACGVPYAVLLPSARAGICWALKAVAEKGTPVLCPVFTCQVVHEAVVRSGGALQLMDSASEGFLMDPQAIRRDAPNGRYALVLCEVYGHSYDLAALSNGVRVPPLVRIVDMAMTVPDAPLLQRISGNDFAVFSFGIGKCIYAGWGGMGLTRSRALADEVRRMRDESVRLEGRLLGVRRGVAAFLRTAAHHRLIYGFSRGLKEFEFTRRIASLSVSGPVRFPERWKEEGSLTTQWFLPTSSLDRKLMMYNLEQRERFARQRLAMAPRYYDNLRDVPRLLCPPRSSFPLSHYTIRVPAAARQDIRRRLWQAGIDVGTLFGFYVYASPADFPHARRIASEVLNLPMNVDLRPHEIDWISACVHRCVSRYSGREYG